MGDATALDGPALLASLRAGLEGIVARGKAEAGDKTMYDALGTRAGGVRVDAGFAAPTSAPPRARRLKRPPRAATRPSRCSPSRGGRRYLGERSVGHIDPGAASTALLLAALADTLES